MFFWLLKYVLLGPVLRLMYRPQVEGLENVPVDGGAILAANHESFLDDLLLPLVVRRRVMFLAKAEYFQKWHTAWFFKAANVIPLPRGGGSSSGAALREAAQALHEGNIIGIFPEGTRSPDGRLYRGKTGVARLALEARVPVVPVAIRGTFEAMPYHRKLPKPGNVSLRFGKPLRFDRHYDRRTDRFALRSVTDEIMYEIMMLSGQEYVDEYAMRVKTATLRGEDATSRPGRTPQPASASREPAPSPSKPQ